MPSLPFDCAPTMIGKETDCVHNVTTADGTGAAGCGTLDIVLDVQYFMKPILYHHSLLSRTGGWHKKGSFPQRRLKPEVCASCNDFPHFLKCSSSRTQLYFHVNWQEFKPKVKSFMFELNLSITLKLGQLRVCWYWMEENSFEIRGEILIYESLITRIETLKTFRFDFCSLQKTELKPQLRIFPRPAFGPQLFKYCSYNPIFSPR